MTKQRECVLKVLRESSGHLTAEEVFLRVRQVIPGVALATVYNNLNALAHAGLIRRISVCHGSDRFDKTPEPHEHLICDGCGAMSDLEINDLLQKLEEDNQVKILSLELNAHYLCPACRAAGKSGAGLPARKTD